MKLFQLYPKALAHFACKSPSKLCVNISLFCGFAESFDIRNCRLFYIFHREFFARGFGKSLYGISEVYETNNE